MEDSSWQSTGRTWTRFSSPKTVAFQRHQTFPGSRETLSPHIHSPRPAAVDCAGEIKGRGPGTYQTDRLNSAGVDQRHAAEIPENHRSLLARGLQGSLGPEPQCRTIRLDFL